MLNDDEIRFKGMNALIAGLGRDDTQTFLKLLANTEPFDYLKWRKEEFGNEEGKKKERRDSSSFHGDPAEFPSLAILKI